MYLNQNYFRCKDLCQMIFKKNSMELHNNASRAFLLLILTISIFSSLNGQDCVNYPDIEGAPCKNCAPAGWNPTNMFQSYIHIIPPFNGSLPETNCNVLSEISGPSPSGGNVVLILGDDNIEDEITIETTLTGLNPGSPYVFGMYWEEMTALCAIHNSDGGGLKIIIDGQVFEFLDAPEWELAEVCFTPTTSFVDVIISTVLVPGEYSSIIVDGNPSCSEFSFTCCELTPLIDDYNFSSCPGETIVLDAEYINAIGSVEIEWTCNPPEGLNYLNATNVISPEFTFPATSSDYFGDIYNFTLIIQDDNCAQTLEDIEVEVFPAISPEFDFELCDLDLVAVLPTESVDGYTGSWDGNDFNIEFAGGTFLPFTFYLNGWQNNCTQSYDYEFFVKAGYTPSFDVEEIYCLSDSTDYTLPNVSEQGNPGQWFPSNEYDPSDLGEGIHTFWFEPNTDDDFNFCVNIYELNIEVISDLPLSFDLPEQFCTDSIFYVLPESSLEGVSGSWTVDSIDLSIPIQDSLLVFTPDQNNNCSTGFNYEYSVIQSITPLFDLPQSICREDIVVSFDSVSTQNIVGSWIPNEFNPDTASSFISLIWIPEIQDSCIQSLQIDIPIIDKETIILDLPEILCAEDTTYVLPDIDTISGSWNIDVINLLNNVDSTFILEYLVDANLCYEDFSDTVFVAGIEVPQFSIADSYCSNDDVFTLPETSDNSVQGTWNINLVDPAMQDSLVIIFTPNSEECSENFIQTLYFTEYKDPIFDLPVMMCGDEAPFTFPNVSQNGINGSWTQDVLDPSMIAESTFSNTFTPDDLTCTSTFSLTIEIFSFENISIEITDPSSCEAEDGSIKIIGASTYIQQSTDDGMTWTPVADIENLSSGSYTVQFRYETFPSCNIIYTSQLNSSDSPIIQELNVTDPSACDQEDGSIECIAEGDDLEYSIDGVSWQSSNIFGNLVKGNYVIYVRVAGQMDCVSSVAAELEDPVSMEICDGIDNNCNGEIDENLDTENYYADHDMDGFGDPDDLINDCIQPLGYILDNTDCDDNNSDIYPGAIEIADNGIDEDCDGADLTTAVHELAGQKIDIFPNPTNGLVTIEMEESSDITISLYDLNGRCLVKYRQLKTVDLSEYTNGIYLMKITDHKSFESIVEKIVLYK